MMEIFELKNPGPYTTVQDGGRLGYQQFGIPLTGALDSFAYRVANFLVGNPEGAAVLETTIMGPELEILGQADLAVTGADAPITVNNIPIPGWSSFRVKAGDKVKIGPVQSGCRNYIAVTGGIDVPLVMGSRSCYVGATIGGYQGRIQARGDVLSRSEGHLLDKPRQLPIKLVPVYSADIVLRAVSGPQDDYFDRGLETFFESDFSVSTHANRMGYRLDGPPVIHREGVDKSIISEPSLPGGVQVTPDGQAIILLVEQTVGGYTKIATVVSTDISRIGQAKPGDRIRFERTNLEKAHALYRERHELLERIRWLLEVSF
jgi:biotin-dependent carboxylase-like uncharacterized protein